MNSFGLLFKVLWTPGEAMLLISKNPRVLAPLIVLTAVSLAVSMVTFTKIDAGELALRQLERSGRAQQMTEEQKERVLAQSRKLTPVFIATAAIGPVIIITFATAIYFAIFTIIGREGTFKTFYAVTAFAYLPLVVRQLAAMIQVSVVPPSSIVPQELGSLSLAVFLDPTSVSRLVYAIALALDITSIWIMTLLIIGFKFLARRSVSTALRVTGVAAVFVVFSAIGVGLQMQQG